LGEEITMSAVTTSSAPTVPTAKPRAAGLGGGLAGIANSFLGGSPGMRGDRYVGGGNWSAGQLVVTDDGIAHLRNSVFDLFHTAIDFRLDDMFAGKYGHDTRIDFPSRETATLNDMVGFGPFRIDVPVPVTMYNRGKVRDAQISYGYDRSIDVRTVYRTALGFSIPIHAQADTVPEGGARFRFDLRYVRIGNSEFQLPDWLGTMLLKHAINAQFGRKDGIQQQGSRSLDVNFAHLYNGYR